MAVVGVALALASCAVLPRSGPADGLIESGATSSLKGSETAALSYALVDISSSVLPFLVDPGAGSLKSSFAGGRGSAVELKVGTGDVLQVTIFESATGGLFVPSDAGSRPGNYVTLPNQTVDRDGYIAVPYAGQVKAGGRTLAEIGRDIEQKLTKRAIEPQVVVALQTQTSNQVTVVGEVGSQSKFAISSDGDRILDVIAKAGGIRYPGHDIYVTLERNKRRAKVWFDAIIKNPAENIYVMPGDTVYVTREQRSFTAFGATGATGQYKFDADHLYFADAVAIAGGLIDQRADPRQVFLYRMENRASLEKMGVDLSKFEQDQKIIPTVYRTNLRDPAGFFVAQKFPMRDGDLIYVSNSAQTELYKFLDLIQSVSGTAGGVGDDIVSVNAARVVLKR